jgi:hypothetical protein
MLYDGFVMLAGCRIMEQEPTMTNLIALVTTYQRAQQLPMYHWHV